MKNVSNETNTKFTAAMMFNTDKATVQALRDELGLGEKETMRLILNKALNFRDELISEAEKIKAEAAAEAARKADEVKAARETARLAKAADAARIRAEKAAEKAASVVAPTVEVGAEVNAEEAPVEQTESEAATA